MTLTDAIKNAEDTIACLKKVPAAEFVFAENGTNPVRFTINDLSPLVEAAKAGAKMRTALQKLKRISLVATPRKTILKIINEALEETPNDKVML